MIECWLCDIKVDPCVMHLHLMQAHPDKPWRRWSNGYPAYAIDGGRA